MIHFTKWGQTHPCPQVGQPDEGSFKLGITGEVMTEKSIEEGGRLCWQFQGDIDSRDLDCKVSPKPSRKSCTLSVKSMCSCRTTMPLGTQGHDRTAYTSEKLHWMAIGSLGRTDWDSKKGGCPVCE